MPGTFFIPQAGIPDLSCRVRHNADLTIANAAWNDLIFNTEDFNVGALHSTVTNSGRITFATAGKYLVGGSVLWTASGVGVERDLRIFLNNTTIIVLNRVAPVASVPFVQEVETYYKFAANDYITLSVYQDSGITLTISTAASYSPVFWAFKLN